MSLRTSDDTAGTPLEGDTQICATPPGRAAVEPASARRRPRSAPAPQWESIGEVCARRSHWRPEPTAWDLTSYHANSVTAHPRVKSGVMTLEGAGAPPCSRILLPALPRVRASRSRGRAGIDEAGRPDSSPDVQPMMCSAGAARSRCCLREGGREVRPSSSSRRAGPATRRHLPASASRVRRDTHRRGDHRVPASVRPINGCGSVCRRP
jgi:hypothetical protein